jgi:hypothetical protein
MPDFRRSKPATYHFTARWQEKYLGRRIHGRISVFERVMGKAIHYTGAHECDMLFYGNLCE